MRARVMAMQARAIRELEAKASVQCQADALYQVQPPQAAQMPSGNALPGSTATEQGIVHYLQAMEERVIARMSAEIARLYVNQAIGQAANPANLTVLALQEQDEACIQQALPELPLAAARDWQNEQNAQLRLQFIDKCGALLSSHEVANLLQSKAKNRAAAANHLKEKGRVLCLRLHGHDVYPAFQFDTQACHVYREMADIIQALSRDFEAGWQMALWFITPNAWLLGQLPLILWPVQKSAVVSAARAQSAAFDA